MNRSRVFFLIILISLFISNYVYADVTIDLEHITREEGLGNQSVSGMVQDQYGFIWFATQGGLYRYDGRYFETFRNDPFDDNSLIHNLIQTIYYDSDTNEIWLGTYQGLSRYNIDQNQFTNYNTDSYDFLDPIIIAIEKDNHGDFWIGSMGGLSKFNPMTEEIVHYEVPGKTVRSICEVTNGSIYVGTYDGLYYIENNQLLKYDIDLSSPYVMDIKEYKPGLITLGLFDGGIVEIDLNQHISNHFDIEGNNVYTHFRDHENKLWIGLWGGGLYQYDKQVEKVIDSQNIKLADDIIYQIYEDDSDVLWILTNGDGVYKYNKRKKSYVEFSSNDLEMPLIAGRLQFIYEDQDKNIWMCIYNQGINVYNPQKDQMLEYTVEDGLNKLTTAMVEVNDQIIVASDNQLLSYNPETQHFSEYLTMDSHLIYSLDQDGKDIWIGTYNDGLFKLNTQTMTLETIELDQSTNSGTIYDILVDSQSRVWAGTSDGIILIENQSTRRIVRDKSRSDSIGSNIINSIHEDRLGNIWFATSGGGIAKWLGEDQFLNFTEKEGLSSNEVIGLLEDSYGRIWASTDNGLSVIDPFSLDILLYTPDDGIGAWEFSRGLLATSDGHMYFGSQSGVTSLPITIETEYAHAPRLYITDVELNDQSIKDILFYNHESIEYKSSNGSLTFHYTAIDYDSPDKIIYFHRLKGYDDEWISTGNISFVNYDRLPPGSYTFEVYAETSKKLNSEIISVEIHVKAPWYRSIFAYIIYGILLILMIIVIFKLKEGSAIREKNSKLNVLNKKLATVNKELESLSLTDTLTGINNRRYFNMAFSDEINLAARGKNHLTLMMLDIDDFKHYNDTYGHVVGDHLLADLAQYIRNVLPRKTDFIARIGGDEFVIVLYDTDSEGAEVIAKRLLETVHEITIQTEGGQITEHVNVSIGVYNFIPDDHTTVNNSLKFADQALYQAKSQGKDQYFIYKNH